MSLQPNKATDSASNPTISPNRIYSWFSALAIEDIMTLQTLLAEQVPVDILHPLRHTTALMESTRLGRAAMVEWLLARGASPTFLSGAPLGCPLHCAIRRQQWDIAQALIEHMETAAVIDAYGATPLHLLCSDTPSPEHHVAMLRVAEELLARACPIDALDHDGTTALHYCALNNHFGIAELLLTHGAKVDALIPDSWVSPLIIAALEENIAMASLLLRYGADPQLSTRDGMSPLGIYPALKDLLRDSPEAPAS